ncbi:MAG TPA: hypothetical protein VGN16_25745 [Acidobacteriaceae bacterium]|jgi:hypothetical protein
MTTHFAWISMLPLLLPGAGVPQQQSPAPEIARAVEQVVNGYRGWGPESNPSGMSFSLRIVNRSDQALAVGMTTTGLPKDQTYTLMSWPIGQPQAIVAGEGVSLNDLGIPVCTSGPGACQSEKPNEPINLAIPRTIPGEPVRLALISHDGKLKVFARLIPEPLANTDRGCTLNAIVLEPNAEILWFEATGFAPNAPLTIDSTSGKEARNQTHNADANGNYAMVDLPFVGKKKNGTVTLTIRSAGCAPTVTVPWGIPR